MTDKKARVGSPSDKVDINEHVASADTRGRLK
jgi:hypothetical protein